MFSSIISLFIDNFLTINSALRFCDQLRQKTIFKNSLSCKTIDRKVKITRISIFLHFWPASNGTSAIKKRLKKNSISKRRAATMHRFYSDLISWSSKSKLSFHIRLAQFNTSIFQIVWTINNLFQNKNNQQQQQQKKIVMNEKLMCPIWKSVAIK